MNGALVVARCVVVGALAHLGCAAGAHGQLAPARACAHAKGPIVVTLGGPSNQGATPPAAPQAFTIELIAPATGQVLESRAAKAGEVDLADLFPRLWASESAQVWYAQAVLGKERVGPPMVLAPMLTPRYSPRAERDGTPQVAPAPAKRVLSGYWTYIDQRVEITTAKGRLVFALRPDAAPNSVANFRDLVGKGFYDGLSIHRLMFLSGRTVPDTIMFGDPTGTGQGGPGYCIDFEQSDLKHAYGTLSYARAGTEPNSAGSQVVVVLSREAGPKLDGRYAAFGQLVSGAETLAAIAKTPVDADGKPREQVVITSARLVDAPPFGTGPGAETDPMEKPVGR